MRQSWETMTSVSAGHIILTPTQPVGSGRPQRGSNPGPPDQESVCEREIEGVIKREEGETGTETERKRDRKRVREGEIWRESVCVCL